MAKTIEINGTPLTEPVLEDGTYTASKVTTDVTTEASGMIMVTKATVVIKDGQATAIVTMKGTGADRFYVSDTATADTIVSEAIAEENKEVGGEFGKLLGGLKLEGESAYSFWPVPITLGEPKIYAARSASHFSKQDIPAEQYYYVHDFQIDAKDLVKVSNSTDLPITEQQEAQRYLNQFFLDGKVVTPATAASVKGKNDKVTVPYYTADGTKISSFIFKMAESDKFRSGWFVDSSILNSTYFSSSNLKKIRYPEGSNGKVTFNPKATYRDEGMTFTATLKIYPKDTEYNQYDADGVYYSNEPLAEQTFSFTIEPLPGDRNVTIIVKDAVSGEEITNAVVAVTKDPVEEGAEPAVIEKNEDGKYTLSVPGTYTVKARAEGYQVPGTEDTEYVLSGYQPKKDNETLTATLIKNEESKRTITFSFKDQMGETVVNPTVKVYPWKDKKSVVTPEADGSYKLYHGVTYGYTVTAEGYEETTKSFTPSKDETIEGLVNKYLSEQRFTFKVYDNKTNETLEGVDLVVKYGPTTADEKTYAVAQPDENGVYTIPIDNRVIAYGHKIGYQDDSLGVWSLGFDPQKDCSFGLKPYPALDVDKTQAGMMKPADKAYLISENTVLLPMQNDSFSAIFVGDGRNVDETKVIALSDENTFTFNVDEFEKEFTVAFKSKKNGNWLNKKITVSKEESKFIIVDYKADYSAVETAKAKVPEDLSIYTDVTKKAVEDAVAGVVEGKNSVEQAAVDAMVQAIEDAVKALKVDKFEYSGTTVQFIKRDGEAFGMWSAMEGSTFTYSDDKIHISIIPSNTKKTYSWMHWGGTNEELTKDVTLTEDGKIELEVDTDMCGWAVPVAPIKTKDDTATTSSQYYLAIPALENFTTLADYTAVDAALEDVPEDLSIYTEETAAEVTAAVNAVVRDKKAVEQAAVDAMAKAINDAVAGLEKKPADYTAVNEAKAKVPTDLSIYTDATKKAVEDALAGVVEGKKIDEQAAVDAMAKAIEDAVAGLEKKPADYSKVEAAKAKVPSDLSIYTDATKKAIEDALAGVEEGKKIDEQAAVDAMAKAINDAVAGLEKKPADYSKVEAAKAKVPSDLSIYTDATKKAIEDALAGVVEGKKIDEQAAVDAMAKAIEDAVAGLEKKPVPTPTPAPTPSTSDNSVDNGNSVVADNTAISASSTTPSDSSSAPADNTISINNNSSDKGNTAVKDAAEGGEEEEAIDDDTAPLASGSESGFPWWIVAVAAVAIVLFILLLKRKKNEEE